MKNSIMNTMRGLFQLLSSDIAVYHNGGEIDKSMASSRILFCTGMCFKKRAQ